MTRVEAIAMEMARFIDEYNVRGEALLSYLKDVIEELDTESARKYATAWDVKAEMMKIGMN